MRWSQRPVRVQHAGGPGLGARGSCSCQSSAFYLNSDGPVSHKAGELITQSKNSFYKLNEY